MNGCPNLVKLPLAVHLEAVGTVLNGRLRERWRLQMERVQ